MDDGSTDGSGGLCDEYALLDNRIEVIHSKNEGVASARNKGIRRSIGRFLCFVDADDYLELDALDNLLKDADNRSADVVTCNFNIVDDHSLKVLCRNFEGGEFLNAYLSSGMSSACGCLIDRRLCIDNQLLFLEDKTYCEDVHFMARLLFFARKPVHLNDGRGYYNYYQRASSVIHNFNRRTMEDEISVCHEIQAFFQAHGVFDTYRRTMNWRLLKSTQELVLNSNDHSYFISLCAQVENNDIWSCPLINNKIKILSYLLISNHSWLVRIILNLRTFLRR